MPSRSGARLCPVATRVRGLTVTLVLASAAPIGTVAAQAPTDTIPVVDTLAAPDSVVVDSTALAQEADSVSADTIFYNMPATRAGVPVGFATGVWEWDRHGIMSSGAATLAELFQTVPGLITLLGGDYGTPAAVSTFGQGGAGYRVVVDGFEVYAVDGGVADLQRIALVGIGRVRLDRSMGQMVIEMWSHEFDDGRPFSVVEAGTGDLDTNQFRGVYTDPTALFGSIAGGLERIDTRGRGPSRDEGGNRTGTWVRYQLHLRDRLALGAELRRMSTQTKVPDYVPGLSRSDLMVRAGVKIVDGVTLQAYAGRSSFSMETDSASTLGGRRRQLGAVLGADVRGLWVNASLRRFEGDLPAQRIDAAGGYSNDRWGGVAGRYATATWNDRDVANAGARAWLSPVRFVTLFGGWESGDFGSRAAPVSDEVVPPAVASDGPGDAAITERETLRAGGQLTAFGLTLAGASLYARSDVALPFGTELDSGALPVVGVHRNGYEVMAAVPTIMRGLTLQGSYQSWDEEGPYLPARIYQASFEFHRVFKESRNLELWWSLGVRGHDPMLTFVPDGSEDADPALLGDPTLAGLARMPFFQSWYFRVQVRVITVRLWLGMDNFTFRRELQSYPGRQLPYARSFFALRWDLWN